jgi:hypothetical protein
LEKKSIFLALYDEGLERCLLIDDAICPDTEEEMRNRLCTDYKVYTSILFHLICNAIKYSPIEESINVEVFFQSCADQNENFLSYKGNIAGFMVTKIINKCESVNLSKL